MGELARGTVIDRPWGRTLGALAMRGLTGQLTLSADGKPYKIAFRDGAVVGATSPLASDAAVRIALTGHLVSSTQVAEIVRRQAAAPHRDEIEVIAELSRLTPEQSLKLRRRVVAQRAARTFSVERGDFVIEDQVSILVVPGTEIDVRAVIYLGARSNLTEQRLATELGQIGQWFQLKQAAIEDLVQFGFGDAERPVLERLVAGADLSQLESSAPGIEQRMVRAAVYSLLACNACDVEATPRTTPTTVAPPPVTPARVAPTLRPAAPPRPDREDQKTTKIPQLARPITPPAPSPLDPPTTFQTKTPPVNSPITFDLDATALDPPTNFLPAALDPPTVLRRKTPTQEPPMAVEVKKLIAARMQLLTNDADHFMLLGVAQDAPPDVIRGAYFALARQLHPDKLTALGITDEGRTAQRLFAQVNAAFAVVGDAKRRHEYTDILERGGEASVRAEEAKAEELAMRALDAEEAFARGEMALRRDQLTTAITEFRRAIELDPETADYQAMYAWAQFCASPDKMAVAQGTRATLEKAIQHSPKAVTSRVVLGRVERMLGRDHEALRHFQEVLKIAPHHSDATSELRVIEARLAQAPGTDRKGLFNRPKR